MTNANARSKYWMFTINNPEPADVPTTSLSSQVLQCMVYQLERGENSTPHYQGYAVFQRPVSFSCVKSALGNRAHVEKRRGTAAQAIAYCTKEETRVESPVYWPDEEAVRLHGESAPKPGQRVDLEKFAEACEEGTVVYEDRFGRFANIYCRYPKFYVELTEHHRQRRISISSNPLTNLWQEELIEILSGSPCRRTIYWYWSSVGNVGKSHFVSARIDAGVAFACNGGRFSDIYFAYSESGCPREFYIDWPRNKSMESFPYEVLESIKNGWFLSSKYGSRLVKFSVPHVVVFSNKLPADDALSSDRLIIKNLD